MAMGHDPLREGEDNTISYKLSVDWNDSSADYLYKLSAYDNYNNGEVRLINSVCGDKAWATRHADHYGLEVPAEPAV